MSADEYVPDEEDVRTDYAIGGARDTIGDIDYRAIPELEAEFDRFLARVRAEAVAPVLALHNADGKRWEGFPRADRRVTYCTHCQLAAPCPSVRAVSIEQETQP